MKEFIASINGKLNPDKFTQYATDLLCKHGFGTDNDNLVYRSFLRKRNGALIPEYPDSTLKIARENLLKCGAEYTPFGSSLGVLRPPLYTYAFPHPCFGPNGEQIGFILVYDINKAPGIFKGFSTRVLNGANDIAYLRNSLVAVFEINFQD